jgi:cytochrome b pre-mRNA-processing protein 3
MILRLFRQPRNETIDMLYGAIVAQGRRPVFYAGFGVPDTVEGRFDMVVLHLVLVLRRLRRSAGGERMAQDLFGAFCRDMDHNLREMGVGDLTVPKQMKRLGEALFGRQKAYEAALAGDDHAALTAALVRNVFSGAAETPATECLARYVRRSAALLETIDVAATPGALAFADPDTILRDTAASHSDR